MKKYAVFSVAFAIFVGGVFAQEPESGKEPETTKESESKKESGPAKDQEWLKQLVGEWDVQYKMYMQPDQPPTEASGTESVRALGAHWIVAESKFMMMGAPFAGILSLGYDPQKKQINGTWIDSFGGYLWVYEGALSESGDTLTLRTEGPSVQDYNKKASYKEVIQITGKDSRTFTSNMELEGGKWMKILTAEYRRK